MKDTKWINDLKLRAGYGITGNQDGLRPYKSLDLYSASGTYYNNGSWPTAFRPSQNANPNLKWEQTAMLNIGLDFTLFNSRLSGTIEWYDKRTKDMLYNYEVSTPTYVYNQIQANVGDMKNTGVEILLNLDVIRNKDLRGQPLSILLITRMRSQNCLMNCSLRDVFTWVILGFAVLQV